MIFAAYVLSSENWQVEQAPRMLLPETEWTLNKKQFDRISSIFDPGAEAGDAFTLHWASHFVYAFPSFSLVLRVLQFVPMHRTEATCILIAPY